MTSKVLKCGAFLIALAAPIAAHAANGIGSVTGTSTPQVITPPTTAAPQTPASPSPPIGATSPGIAGPVAPVAPNRMSAPSGSAAKPPG
jgi:hypothetical protein